MEIEIIKPITREVNPNFISLAIPILRAQGIIDDSKIDLYAIRDAINSNFGVKCKVEDIIPFYQLDIDIEDVTTMYTNCVQKYIGTLDTI